MAFGGKKKVVEAVVEKPKEDYFGNAKSTDAETIAELEKRRATRASKKGSKVIEGLSQKLAFKEFIYDEQADKLMEKYAQMKGTDKISTLWRGMKDYKKNFQKLPISDSVNFVKALIEKCFEDAHVTTTFSDSQRTYVVSMVESGKIGEDLFEDFYAAMLPRLEIEFAGFKKSKQMEAYFQNTIGIDSLISDEHALLYFEKFLASEYSSENLDFYEEVNRYLENWKGETPAENYKAAMYIQRMFISQEAPSQVNIPAKMRLSIEKKLLRQKEAPKLVFDAAHHEIYLLMRRDGWPRFRRSKYWKQYMDSVVEVDEVLSPHQLRKFNFLEHLGEDSMEKVVLGKTGRDFFGKYLQVLTENDGSMDFYNEAKQFQANNEQGPMEMELNAQAIFSKFLDTNAPFPTKIPEELRAELERAVDHEVHLNMFEDAIRQMIQGLIDTNCFNRFKYTGLYTSYRLLLGGGG